MKVKINTDFMTVSELRALLRYDSETGKLYWKVRRPHAPVGSEAFIQKDKKGYLRGTVMNRMKLAHHVVWAICNGHWPDHHIDHIDGDTGNNRIGNLRRAEIGENCRNKLIGDKNKSGYKGGIVEFCAF